MRWPRRIMAVGIVTLAATCAFHGAASAGITLRLTTPTVTVSPGDTFFVQAQVTLPDSVFNAFELVVHYDSARVTFVPASPVAGQIGSLMTGACANQFHVFNAFADSTVADVSLLCAGVSVSGPGEIYRLKFVAGPTAGTAAFSVGATTRFYNAGVFVKPVNAAGFTMVIGHVTGVAGGAATGRGFVLEAPRPNPLRAGESSSVSFALPAPATVALEVLDLQGRRVAARELGERPAGGSTVHWALPGIPAGRYELRLRADGRVVARAAWVVLR